MSVLERADSAESRNDLQFSISPKERPGSTGGRGKHALAIFFLAATIVACFWRVFFLGQTLIDLKTLNNQLPWGYADGLKSDYPYDRRDPTDMYLTREYFVVQAYRDGELPLWNPYTMAGHPIYADGVTRIFSPSLLFYRFLDLPLGYSVARIAELFMGAMFLYLFLADLGVSAPGALFGALVFAFSSHAMLHLVGLGWWGGLMWLPLILLCADRALRKDSFIWAALGGLALGAQIYCGYTANEIYYIGALFLYYLFHIWMSRSRGSLGRSLLSSAAPAGPQLPGRKFPEWKRSLGLLFFTSIIGMATSAPIWLPVMEQLKYSNRLIVPTQIGYVYLPPWYLATLFFPSLFGAPYDSRALTLFVGINVSHDHTLYFGIAGLAMAAVAVFSFVGRQRTAISEQRSAASDQRSAVSDQPSAVGDQRSAVSDQPSAVGDERSAASDQRSAVGGQPSAVGGQPSAVGSRLYSFGAHRLAFFVFLLIFAMVIMTAAPLYVHVTRFIPVVQTIRVIMRADVLFGFASAVLSAFGCEILLASSRRFQVVVNRGFTKALITAFGFAVIATLASYIVRADGLQSPQQGRGKIAFVRKSISLLSTQFTPPSAGIVLPLLFGAGLTVALYAAAHGRMARRAFYVALTALLLVDLAWNSRNFEHTYDRSRVYPHTEITDALLHLPPGRLLPTPSDLDLNRHMDLGQQRQKIITPPNTLLAYGIPVVTGKDQVFPRWYQEFASLIEGQPNMSHVVFDGNHSPLFDLIDVRYILRHASDAAPPGCRLLMTADGLSLYRNPSARPRAFFPTAVRIADDEHAAQALLERIESTPGTNPADTIVVEDRRHILAAGAGAADIIEDHRNLVRIAVNAQTGGMLFLADTYYPGWRAEIDGIPTTICRADVAFRAVQVPAGRHVVTFRFVPACLTQAAWIALAGFMVALGPAAARLGRGRHNPD